MTQVEKMQLKLYIECGNKSRRIMTNNLFLFFRRQTEKCDRENLFLCHFSKEEDGINSSPISKGIYFKIFFSLSKRLDLQQKTHSKTPW